MANYAVVDFLTALGDLETVMAAMEVHIETVDNTKTIRMMSIHAVASGTFQGVIIYDT